MKTVRKSCKMLSKDVTFHDISMKGEKRDIRKKTDIYIEYTLNSHAFNECKKCP